MDQATKLRLLAAYDKRIAAFEGKFQKQGWVGLGDTKPVSYGFLCRHYQICLLPGTSQVSGGVSR